MEDQKIAMRDRLDLMKVLQETAEVVDSFKAEIMEEAKIFSMKVSPETTPEDISNYRHELASPSHFRDISSAVQELQGEFSRQGEDYYFNISTLIHIYLYLYFQNNENNPFSVYQTAEAETIRYNFSQVLSSVEQSLEEWEKLARDNESSLTITRGQVSEIGGQKFVFVTFFPAEYIGDIEDEIRSRLQNMDGVSEKLVNDLSKFPEKFNQYSLNQGTSKLEFFYTYTHEFSHAYVRKRTESNHRIFNEATAQMVDRYLEESAYDENGNRGKQISEAVNFDHGPGDYSAYDDSYREGASDMIFRLIELMKLKSQEKISQLDMYESRSFSLIDWLIYEELEAIKSCGNSGGVDLECLIKQYLPVQINHEVEQLNQIVEQDIKPVIREVGSIRRDLNSFVDYYQKEREQELREIIYSEKDQRNQEEMKEIIQDEINAKNKLHEIVGQLEGCFRGFEHLENLSQEADLDLVYEYVEENLGQKNPSQIIQGLTCFLAPSSDDIESLKEEIKSLRDIKKRIQAIEQKDLQDLGTLEIEGYKEPVRELESQEREALDRLMEELNHLEEKCRQLLQKINDLEVNNPN